MSYDLTLIRPLEGEEPMAAYRRVEDLESEAGLDLVAPQDRVVPEPARAEMQRLAGILQARIPQLTQFEPPEPLPWIELNEEELEVQVSIHEHSVGITMPYFRESAGAMLELSAQLVEVLGAEAGFVAYDPQLDRIVTPSDLGALVPQYRSVDNVLDRIEALSKPQQPWWKFW